MRVFFWRVALVAILLITLLGSIVLLIVEPGLGSILGVIGSVGSLMGAFVTTGLDIASTRSQKEVGPPPASIARTIPHEYKIVTPKRRKGINFAAITKAATLGSLGLGFLGLFYALPYWGLALCCVQFAGYFSIGVSYVLFARSDLPRDESVPVSLGLVGGLLSGIMPSVVSIIANQFSEWVLFPAQAAYLRSTFASMGASFLDIATGLTFTVCFFMVLGTIVAGVGGVVMAAILRRR